MTLAKYMVGSIDDDGYLRRNLSSISDDIAFSLGIETSGGARTHPAGDPPVGAGGDRFAQPAGVPVAANERARGAVGIRSWPGKILTNYFDEFTKKHYEKLMTRLSVGEDEFRDAIEEIVHLSPSRVICTATAKVRPSPILCPILRSTTRTVFSS